MRVRDRDSNWRIVYRIDTDAVVIVDVFAKKTEATQVHVIKSSRDRLRRYDTL